MCIVFSFLVMKIWYLPMLCFLCYSECISTPRAGRKFSLTTMRIKLATFGIQVHQITSKISSYMWFLVELLCVKWLFKITKTHKNNPQNYENVTLPTLTFKRFSLLYTTCMHGYIHGYIVEVQIHFHIMNKLFKLVQGKIAWAPPGIFSVPFDQKSWLRHCCHQFTRLNIN